ncbi:HipA family kinase [Silvibacterium sp.]|uniref:HipA family kinase n=1 Tax=Silvibacterium sp. TaxID=1964179 RepID=UPI0039E44166
MIRTVQATRYALPLREGGSLPGLVEADDLGFYVVKFRGAGQGPLALVAELVAGEIGRRLGLAVPELVFVEVDPALGRNDPDAEIRHLLKASVGLNLGLDYLPGSIMFDREAGDTASAEVASMAIWFDAFVQNVDRTARNPNLLVWHRSLHFIDQGAALYFHHNWQSAASKAESPFPEVAKHLLLPWASAIPAAAAKAKSLLDTDALREILALVPDEWIESGERSAQERRNDYLEYLTRRLSASANFEEEAIRSHDRLL